MSEQTALIFAGLSHRYWWVAPSLLLFSGIVAYSVYRYYLKIQFQPNTRLLRKVRRLQVGTIVFFGLSFCFTVVTFLHVGCAVIKGHEVQCMSNLRQITRSASLYTQDNDDHFPPCQNWQELVLPYTPIDVKYKAANKELLVCPSSSSTSSYAMNRKMSAVSVNDLDAPADTILYFESDAAMRSFSGSISDVALTRHHGAPNFAFTDGHVKRVQSRFIAGLVWTSKTPSKPIK